jgi:hypothetical protein
MNRSQEKALNRLRLGFNSSETNLTEHKDGDVTFLICGYGFQLGEYGHVSGMCKGSRPDLSSNVLRKIFDMRFKIERGEFL